MDSTNHYDVVIAGGSIAGLLCAREIARRDHKVLVVEEDYEIGTPEHCGGVVSTSGLEDLGIIPNSKTFDHLIKKAEIFSPNGSSFTLNSEKQKVAEVNRRQLDKQVAHQAQQSGAEILVGTSFKQVTEDGQLKTSDGTIRCKIFVDARGVSSLIHKDRKGILSSAQYEVYASWITKGKVEVYFDQEKYPGFFAWIIPSDQGIGKVGVAGRGINSSDALKEFLAKKANNNNNNFSIIRKIYAPIWIKGPIKEFVSNNKNNIVVVTIGDAAGQSKPTTAGGIYSCGMGGIFAGNAISRFLESGKTSDLKTYQENWKEKFGKEFDKQLLTRKLLERLDNKTIDKLFDSVTPEIMNEISEKEDFDFHAGSIIKLLGMKTSLKTVKTILGGEIKKLLP